MPTTVHDLRRGSRAAVLRELLFAGPQTRVGLAGRTGLSSASVTNIVGDLLADGLVVEVGTEDSNGGRPRVTLRANADFGVSIGVDVGETGLRVEAFDLGLRELARTHAELPPHDHVAIADSAAAAVRELCDALPGRRVLGVGVAVPGAVEHDPDAHVHAPSVGWDDVPLGALFRERIDLPVSIENGAKTLGLAEMALGAGRGRRDAIVTLWGTGVGAAIFTGGALYYGAASSAGEWGHTNVVVGGAECRCGARGCLEAYVGAPALAGAAPAEVDRAATIFGTAAADLVNLFNPELIVIGGWLGQELGPRVLPRIRETIARQALPYSASRVSVELGELGNDAVALGAATLVLERLLAAGGRV